MISLNGKKLLILGGGPNETTIVARAKELGIYTIVTDYNLDYELSPAKKMADEVWDISWSDIDTLGPKCIEENVDGIISGYSEIRVENNIKLCEKVNKPCYINMEQLDITRDKIKFKQTCRKNGVPVTKEYASISEVDSYPVIIKPTDRAGSIGISVANNYTELVAAYEYAMSKSLSKTVIIEEYIYKNNANKIDVYYGITDGKITYLGASDVLTSPKNSFDKVIQNGWVFPSIHEQSFYSDIDPAIRKMIENMGIQNGYIFFSGFVDDYDNYQFFECGFRLCGGHLYNYFPKIGHYNTLDLFICYALTGTTQSIFDDVKPGNPLKNVTINIFAKKGTLSKIDGFQKISEMDDCFFSLVHGHIGQECTEENAILAKIGVVYFCNESAERLAEDVQKMNELLCIEDENGNDMIFDKVDPEIIRNYWF